MDQLDNIQNLIYVIRGQRVMFDFDLARLYEVEALRAAITVNISLFIPIPLLIGTPCTLAGSVNDPYVQYYSRQILWHS